MTPVLQITAVSAIIVCALALCYFGLSRHNHVVAEKDSEIVRVETANTDLQDEIASLRDEIGSAVRDREQAEARSSALAGQADALRNLLITAELKLRSLDEQRSRLSEKHDDLTIEDAGNLKNARIRQLTLALEQTQRELNHIEAQRAALMARLTKLEADRFKGRGRHGRHKAKIEAAIKELQLWTAERDGAVKAREHPRARIAQLDQEWSQRELPRSRQPFVAAQLIGFISPQAPEIEVPRPEMLITDAPPEPEPDSVGGPELGRLATEFERVLASTGLDIRRLFPQFTPNRGEGGPFVPPPKGDLPGTLSSERLAAMRSLMKSLPLSTPLDSYQLESRFGPRRDPFNRRLSFHTGLDLSAPYMSPIYATAPGIVTYAGYRGDYGKVVEIDHGNGIATLYGHMHRYIVAVGQRVAEHTQIGLLGSSGRSSGPHVHYEILVNAEPQDPEKFIGLARLIPITDR